MTEQKPVAIGDVFTCSWGYDQTNIDWYVVTKLSKSGASATFMRIGARRVGNVGTSDAVVPDPKVALCSHCMRAIRPLAKADGEQVWRHVSNGQTACRTDRIYGIGVPDSWEVREGSPSAEPNVFTRRLKIMPSAVWANGESDFQSMKRWDGEAEYQTAAGFGH